METLSLPFFPFPHIIGSERRPGLRFSWPARCNQCDRQCERLHSASISTCSYGVNYIWPSPELLVFGFLVHSSAPTNAQKKMLRNSPDHLVKREDVELAARAYREMTGSFDDDIKVRKAKIVTDYVNTKQYEKDFLELLKPQIQESFSFLHDYKQFIARVRQNINVVIEARNEGGSFEEKLTRAPQAVAAIYWASNLMEEKLRTAFLLLHPEEIADPNKLTQFRLHGAVLKIVRIYNAAFREKNVALRVIGESIGTVKGNPVAVPVIPHTLIDNALKYSKRDSEVRIEFHENAEVIEFAVTSHGPKIAADESDKIFELFYRGQSARAQEDEGAGFGLYLAQFIARKMGTKIEFSQDGNQNRFGYRTTFSIQFPRER